MSRAGLSALIISACSLAFAIVAHVLLRKQVLEYVRAANAEYLLFVLILLGMSVLGVLVWYLLYRPTPLLAAKIAMSFFALAAPISALWPGTIDFLINFDPEQFLLRASTGDTSRSGMSDAGFIASLVGFAYFANLYVNLGRPENRSWADTEW